MAREEKIKTELGQRFRDIRKSQGDPERDEFCLRLGISSSSLGNYERGDRVPDSAVLQAYRLKIGVDVNWLLTGHGEMFQSLERAQGTLTVQQTLNVADATSGRSDLVPVPLYNVHAAAGNGLVPVDEEEQREEIILTRTFLRRVGAQAESCHIIFAKGESMQPTIPDGSLLLIDLSKSQIVDNGVFVFRVGEDIKVKRARWRVDQRLDLVSDNQLAGFPPETYTLDEAATIQPIGRVMCIMRVP